MDFDQSHVAVIVSVMLLAISSMISGWRISRLEKQNRELWHKLNSMEVLRAVAEEIRK